jgi:hypothetical protein
MSQSIYHFRSEEDHLAWRTIGFAARQALELGLHRNKTLAAVSDASSRSLAIRVFWTTFVLDRQWSFATRLSFALVDHDIDPELPEPVSPYYSIEPLHFSNAYCSRTTLRTCDP